jgi:tRNA (adenine57-N1/adenine58-N1)-methyltransferase catalytic subunit
VNPSSAAEGADRSTLRDREPVVLLDRKGRSYLRTLRRGGRMSIRGAPISCDDVIGQPEGSTVTTASGEGLLALRPTYAQLIPSLPRQAQPIYPKDVGPLLLWGDIGPGHLVVEIGTGPAALTLALLRGVGPTGHLVSYELREDFAVMARDNVARFHGAAPNWTLRVADALAGIVECGVDRMVIDLAEPWTLLDQAAAALRAGGVLTAFVPTALQIKQHVDALVAHPRFGAVEAFETLLRFWHVGARSLRPEHRMVAHTGFLIVARRLADTAAGLSELTPRIPYSTEESDGYPGIAGSTHDDEGGDPPEDLEDD